METPALCSPIDSLVCLTARGSGYWTVGLGSMRFRSIPGTPPQLLCVLPCQECSRHWAGKAQGKEGPGLGGLVHCTARQQALHSSPALQALGTAIHLYLCMPSPVQAPSEAASTIVAALQLQVSRLLRPTAGLCGMPHGPAASTGPCGLLHRAPSPHICCSGRLPPPLVGEAAWLGALLHWQADDGEMGSKCWTSGQKPEREQCARSGTSASMHRLQKKHGADHDQKHAVAACVFPRMVPLKGKRNSSAT